jgi:NAD+ synthase (glutamine-hydrolysing)
MKVKVSMAQIRNITGDLQGNTERIFENIQKAIEDKSDIVVFCETAITGYACSDLFLHNGFISHQLEFLYKKIVPFTVGKNIMIVLGFVDRNGHEKDGFPSLYNSCCVIQNGKILDIYNKILLAKRGQHDDFRYFEPGKFVKVFDFEKNGEIIKFTPVICQDIWNDEVVRDVVQECKNSGSQLVLVLNQSYFYFNKQVKRKKLVSNHCVEKNMPMVYVNNVGVGDVTKNLIIYPGNSFACNFNGDVLAECKSFEEDFKTVEIDISNPKNDNVIQTRENVINYKLSKDEKYNEIFNSLSFCVKEYFSVLNIKKALVYLSGGIDSSVVASIVANSFEKENIVFVSSPTEDNGEVTRNNAQVLADNLGIELHWVSMQKAYEGFINDYKDAFNEEPSPRSKSAYQAIGRTPQSIGICHKYGSIANIGCSNQTENILGFSSFNDVANSSAIGLINDLTKIEVYELAEFINKKFNKEIIPAGLYNGQIKSSAELNDNKGEDPYNYHLYAPICSVLIRFQMDISEMIQQFKDKTLNKYEFGLWPNGKTIYENVSLEEFEKTVWHVFELSKRSVYKSAASGPTPIISPYSRGFSSRECLLNAYKGHYIIESPAEPIKLEIKKLHSKVVD